MITWDDDSLFYMITWDDDSLFYMVCLHCFPWDACRYLTYRRAPSKLPATQPQDGTQPQGSDGTEAELKGFA